ncbi:hypothetical protein MBM_05201 [Drepanopeziza brunnea f. sp. 'multigermtubi' MB_m1]|uniref:Uncharacterized protein n=1 Tax=Marssonina brunnea f. sp. multigermtubi (strain MB_m1) TaxID=1072389 RepID=K1WW91_MARBU|nr:uncharacterized protein MBM_05201 [Drepanopeziza brunnea f. sp. 'multigermtubi' MB_m1]EKD16732.1 hypothetical protein MBM_05201 [Drepanopeziza brunnea f. sp. 'multigermtubi' MB_m1]
MTTPIPSSAGNQEAGCFKAVGRPVFLILLKLLRLFASEYYYTPTAPEPQALCIASQSATPLLNRKGILDSLEMASTTYNALPQTPTTPYSMNYNDSIHKPVNIHVGSPTQYFGEEGTQSHPQSPAMSFLSEKDRAHAKAVQKLKSRIRYLRLLSRLAGTAIAIAIVAQEGQTLYAFYTTHTTIRSGRGPWAKETQLWSSLLMFCLSLITALLGVGMVIAYYFSIKAANTIAGVQVGIVIVVDVGHLVVWIVVAVAYRVAKNGRDLWGWACSPIAEGIPKDMGAEYCQIGSEWLGCGHTRVCVQADENEEGDPKTDADGRLKS